MAKKKEKVKKKNQKKGGEKKKKKEKGGKKPNPGPSMAPGWGVVGQGRATAPPHPAPEPPLGSPGPAGREGGVGGVTVRVFLPRSWSRKLLEAENI